MDERLSLPRRVAMLIGALMCLSQPAAHAQLRVDAYAGEPFGVARVTVMLEPGTEGRYWLYERDGRAMYPVFVPSAFRRLLGNLLGKEEESKRGMITAMFLFQGEDPLEITLETPHRHVVQITPEKARPGAYRRLLQQWWRDYARSLREQAKDGEYTPILETYLSLTLARRLGFPAPSPHEPTQEPVTTLQLLNGAEKLRLRMMREALLSPVSEPVVLDPPAPIDWPERPQQRPDPLPTVESLATRIPRNCFYVRFGKFSNLLWLLHLSEEHQGDLRNMLAPRGMSENLNDKLQTQLAVRYSILADLLGDQVVADVGAVGRDTFLREGPALAIVLEARNEFLLNAALVQERTAALLRDLDQGITETKLQIAGREVSWLATPDRRVCSYYAADGKFRYLCNSRALMQSMLETIDSGQSLADDAEFQHVRTRYAADRGDLLFAYFSPQFFQGLVSPHYQIELYRRLRSSAELELFQAARFAGRMEGWSQPDLEKLISADLLPANFGHHADGGHLQWSDGRVSDSRRGSRGYLLPVVDVAVQRITESEQQWWASRAEYYLKKWQNLSPLVVVLQRELRAADGLEQLAFEAQVASLAEEQFGGVLSLLGEPSPGVLQNAQDVIAVQASLRGGLVAPSVPPHQLYLGVRNQQPSSGAPPEGLLRRLWWLQGVPGFVAAWPQPGFLDMIPQFTHESTSGESLSQLPLGLWRWQGGEFSVLGFDPQLVQHAVSEANVQAPDSAAQGWLRIDDLAQSELAPWIKEMEYQRQATVSRCNLALLDLISNQFQLPAEQARDTAEQILGGRMVCTLQGQYELASRHGAACWVSVGQCAAQDFQSPLLHWFRGAQASLRKQNDGLLLRGTLLLKRSR